MLPAGTRRADAIRIVAVLIVLAILSAESPLLAQGSWIHGRTFFSDDDAATVKFSDLVQADRFYLSKGTPVAEFPKLDPAKMSLTNVAVSSNFVMVGVHAKNDEAGGWILISTGVVEEAHGNHSHWYYPTGPRVVGYDLAASLNPVRCEVHDSRFYLIGDQAGSWIQLDPRLAIGQRSSDSIKQLAKVSVAKPEVGRTLLASGYAFWSSNEAMKAQPGLWEYRPLSAIVADTSSRQIMLPGGETRSIAAWGNHVFCGSSSGLSVIADIRAAIPLATPITIPPGGGSIGAIAASATAIAAVKRADESAELLLVNPARTPMTVTTVTLGVAKEATITSSTWIQTRRTSPLVLLFAEQPAENKLPDQLIWIETDPNYDGDLRDARVSKTFDIPRVKVLDGQGHHEIVFNYERRFGVVANSGDGTLSLVDLEKMSVIQSFLMEGRPGHLATLGGRSGGHHD